MTNYQHFISLQEITAQHLHHQFFNGADQSFSRQDLFAHALQLSLTLPENQYAVNLCSDRYLFTVSFLAVLLRKQANLLPPNQAPQTLHRLFQQYPRSYCLIDNEHPVGSHCFHVRNNFVQDNGIRLPALDINRTAAISFTSGSTGEPKVISKTWRELQQSALLAIERFQLGTRKLNLVATVPPQHTYGLETSVFWPLFSTSSISIRRPFFPEDIRQTVAESSQPCMLITTPTHIKACARSGLNWHNIDRVLSSTAPLSRDLAIQAESCFGAPVYEILGSTETLSYASRHQLADEKWRPYDSIKVTARDTGFAVSGGHLLTPVATDDQFDIDPAGHFSLLGRSRELVKIAGKRTSLNELNRIINNIPGVDDAMFFLTGHERLGALVKGKLSKQQILDALKQYLDEVFLPRPLYLVDRIPRNDVGKIIKAQLDELIREQQIA